MNNINKLLSLNEDFNFNDFSKKVSNKDIVKIIKENNRQNYIIEKFDIEAKVLDLFGIKLYRYNFKIESIHYKNNIYYSEDFDNLVFEPNEEIKIILKGDITNCINLFYNCKFTYLDLSHSDTSKVTDMSNMFYLCENLKELNLSFFNTSEVTDMSYMFFGCSRLEELDLSSFDTSKVIDMRSLFDKCYNLKEVNLNSFNTSKVTDMSYMFAYCYNLKTLNLTSFDTSKVTDMTFMFSNCEYLKELNLSSFDTSKVTDMSYMFVFCYRLEELNLSSFDTSNVTNMTNMFINCNIQYKKDIENWLRKGGISSNLPYPNVKPLQK